MSDIVFLRAWTKVEVPKFYNPLTTALQPRDRVWQGMKTVAELRKEHNLPIPVNKDSLYKVTSGREKKILVIEFPSLSFCVQIVMMMSIRLSYFKKSFLLRLQPIERQKRKFNPLVIPKSLQAALPFKSKPKNTPSQLRPLLEKRRAVIMEPRDRKVHALVQQLQLMRHEKVMHS